MNKEEILVKRAHAVQLPVFRDARGGNLSVVQAMDSIPYDIKRVYYITSLCKDADERGAHAHHAVKQSIFCLHGSFQLNLDDGIKKQSVKLDSPEYGIVMDTLIWHTMSDFTDGCVILVLASELYNEDDYIEDYDEYLKLLKSL